MKLAGIGQEQKKAFTNGVGAFVEFLCDMHLN